MFQRGKNKKSVFCTVGFCYSCCNLKWIVEPTGAEIVNWLDIRCNLKWVGEPTGAEKCELADISQVSTQGTAIVVRIQCCQFFLY